MLLATGRRTVTRWLKAAGVTDDWDRYYDLIKSVGRRSGKIATALTLKLLKKGICGPDRILVAIDDTVTKREGPQVEGAGIHHNPTPGAAGGDWMYGHVWVTLGVLAKHPLWGVICLPLRAMLYIRECNLQDSAGVKDWEFQTKHQLAARLVKWFLETVRQVGQQTVWIVADGAYAARPFIAPVLEAGAVVVSRLRRDTKLNALPTKRTGKRGRPPIYGEKSISLSMRAGHPQGWQPITYDHRGENVTRECKTFLATSRLVRGVLRVVIVKQESGGWVAFFCTDPDASAADILSATAARWAIEETFHDVKELWGAGQQGCESYGRTSDVGI